MEKRIKGLEGKMARLEMKAEKGSQTDIKQIAKEVSNEINKMWDVAKITI